MIFRKAAEWGTERDLRIRRVSWPKNWPSNEDDSRSPHWTEQAEGKTCELSYILSIEGLLRSRIDVGKLHRPGVMLRNEQSYQASITRRNVTSIKCSGLEASRASSLYSNDAPKIMIFSYVTVHIDSFA